jgi:hypothetical protein
VGKGAIRRAGHFWRVAEEDFVTPMEDALADEERAGVGLAGRCKVMQSSLHEPEGLEGQLICTSTTG